MAGDATIKARLRLTANAKGFVAEVGRADQSLDKLRRRARRASTATDQLSRSTNRSARASHAASAAMTSQSAALVALRGALPIVGVAALASGALRAARASIAAGVATEGWRNQLTAAMGGAAAAADTLAYLKTEADRLGISITGLAGAYASLAAAARGTALEGEAIREVFISVAEASRVLNLTADQTRGALTALQQMISKGRVSAEELSGQLGERLPGALQIAARAMGVTTAELYAMLQRGELLATDLLPRFARELRASVAGGLPAAVDSSAAAFGRLETAIHRLKTAVAESGLLDLAANLATGAAAVLNTVSATETPLAADNVAGRLEAARGARGAAAEQLNAASARRGRSANPARATLRRRLADLDDEIARLERYLPERIGGTIAELRGQSRGCAPGRSCRA